MQKTRVKKKVKAYSVKETKQIIECFYNCNYPIKSSQKTLKNGRQKIYYYRNSKAIALHYAPLIEFRFLTGCRPIARLRFNLGGHYYRGKPLLH